MTTQLFQHGVDVIFVSSLTAVRDMGVARGAGEHGGHAPPSQSIRDKNKDLGNYDKHLTLRNCFLAGLLISGLTKEKYKTTLLFALARVVMAQPQWPAQRSGVTSIV